MIKIKSCGSSFMIIWIEFNWFGLDPCSTPARLNEYQNVWPIKKVINIIETFVFFYTQSGQDVNPFIW